MNLYKGAYISIGELARRTRIGVSTLRAWETRHGFPVAKRLPSGHRRYSEQDVESVLTVERERRAARRSTPPWRALEVVPVTSSPPSSRRSSSALPHVSPVVLSKRTMLAVSRAIEDEAATRAEHSLFLGAFQEPRFWRASADRWAHLIGGSDAAVVLGSFPQFSQRADVFEIAVPSGSPVLREWTVVCDSPAFSACLVGIEQIGTVPQSIRLDASRLCGRSSHWPFAEAARTGFALAVDCFDEVGAAIGSRLQEPVHSTYDSIRVATAITNRIVSYMERH